MNSIKEIIKKETRKILASTGSNSLPPRYISSAFHIYDLFHILYVILFLSREYMNSQLTSLSMCGFNSSVGGASHWYRGGHGFDPVEVRIFSGFFLYNFFNCNSLRGSVFHTKTSKLTTKSCGVCESERIMETINNVQIGSFRICYPTQVELEPWYHMHCFTFQSWNQI